METPNDGPESGSNRMADFIRILGQTMNRAGHYRMYPPQGVAPKEYERLQAEANAERDLNDAIGEDLQDMADIGVDTLHTDTDTRWANRLETWEQDLDSRGMM